MNTKRYRLDIDAHHRNVKINKSDYAMVCIHLEHYPEHSFKKLQAQATGSFHILHKFGLLLII